MSAALPAYMLEAIFYLGSIFEQTRECLKTFLSRRWQALFLWVSALLPYLIFATGTGTANKHALEIVALLTAAVAYWYLLFPRRAIYDLGFLVIAAAPIVLRAFGRLYASPDPDLKIGDALGHLMWIRLSIAALLIFREWEPGPFGFWPTAQEWKTGTLWFTIAVIPLTALALSVGLVRFAPLEGPWWRFSAIVIGSFLGVLWVVALSEELFFRGVVERACLNRWSSPALAIAISAVLYGASHLWYRGFPNWREALVTAALGIPCGIAYQRTGSVRTPMVTHAFAVATVRAFFRYN